MPETQSQLELSPSEELIRRYEVKIRNNNRLIVESKCHSLRHNMRQENAQIIAKINEIKRKEKIL